jgi:uncharacterized protein YecT (DUF1311 family)
MLMAGDLSPLKSKQKNGGVMKYFRLLCGMMLLMLFAGVDLSSAASFDCSKAATQSERLICGDQQLSSADDQLARVYAEAVLRASNQGALISEQRSWIKTGRDTCQDAECMLKAYKSRIAELQSSIQKSMREILREANEHFTFRGKPINPRQLSDLLPLLSDTLPGPVAVDVEGGKNRYFAEITAPEKTIVRATWSEEKEQLFFQYRHLGVLANGMHVVETMAGGGGSGVFCDLLLVRFLVDAEYGDGGTPRSRLVMMRTGEFALGAGYDGSIKVQPYEISIGPGGSGIREKAQTEVVSFK